MRVSIILFVRNGLPWVRRAAESVLSQTWANVELVVQDAVSTDGTTEYLRSLGDRVQVVSEPDNGPAEGFWRVMNRCQGDIIGCCLADEAMMPDAAETAVRHFSANPRTGAIIGDAMAVDIDHNPITPMPGAAFDLVGFLCASYMPYYNASFFRRSALQAVGLKDDGDWTRSCFEFEIWLRLAISQNIDYVPHLMARYAWHGGQLSNTSLHVMDNIKGRLSLIERVFSPTGFLGDHPVLRDYCLSKHCEAFLHHLRVKKQDDAFTELSAIHLGIVARRHGAPLDEAALAASLWMHAAECFAGQGRNDQAEDCRQRARMIGG